MNLYFLLNVFISAEKYEPHHKIGEQFTEILIKDPDSLSQVLRFLEEFDFRVRWPALKLLANLVANKPKEIQEIILVSPMGVSKLMDMLSDSREIIRNEVSDSQVINMKK